MVVVPYWDAEVDGDEVQDEDTTVMAIATTGIET
jgi:hypothetical protein